MKLRTEVSAPKFDFDIDYSTKILTIGSCFSDVIGNSLAEHKFKVLSNPFGTVFNVQSVSDLIHFSIDGDITRDWVTERDGCFFHYGFHSEINAGTKELLFEKISKIGTQVEDFLQETDLIVITLGSSWVYEYEGKVVSNCHKMPASAFFKRILNYEEQGLILKKLIEKVRQVNPEVRFVLTVSPVRHIKDGISQNSLSKSILRMLCDFAVSASENVYYFPSYEVMLDDLRDYRFYKSDLIHPNEQAEEHICGMFFESCASHEVIRVKEAWNKIRMALNHRPFNPQSESHKAFLLNLVDKIQDFERFFDVSTELSELKAQIERTY